MSGNADNDFNSRLKRISEQKSAQQFERMKEPPIRSFSSRRTGGGGAGVLISFLFMGIIPIAGLAGFLFVAKEPIKAMAEIEATAEPSLIQMLLGAPRTPPEPAGNNGSAPRITGRMGNEFNPLYAVAAGGEAVEIETLAMPAEATAPQPPKTEMFAANAECTLRRPQSGEKLINVNIFGGTTEAPLRVLQDDQVIDILTDAAQDVVTEGKSFDDMPIDRGIVTGIDVYVTDTSAPLYLMLQTVSDDMMWTIHAAPGVRIAHVAMITDGTSALTGDIGGATFEALRTSDYGHSHEHFHSRMQPESYDCMTMAFQKPDESWGAWAGSKEGNTMDGNLLFGQTNGYEAYAHWYRGVIGQEPDTNLVVAASAPAVLVGPKPAAPLPIQAGAAETIRLMQADYVITGTPEEREAKTLALYQQLLTEAAGGDPKLVMPPKRELVQAAASEPTVKAEAEAAGGGLLSLLANGGPTLRPSFTNFGSNLQLASSIQQVISFNSLLKEGEAMPREALLPLYAMLRAGRAAEGFCADTLAEIATSCTVEKVGISGLNDGVLTVRTDFVYEPNYVIGEAAPDNADGYNTAFVPDVDMNKTHDAPEERRALLARALRLCDLLRAEYGNCAVDTSGFYVDRPANFSGTDVRAGAAVWVSVRAVENPFEESQLQARVDALWPTVP